MYLFEILLHNKELMQKVCPRCASVFTCREDNILECGCVQVILSPEQLDYIAGHYIGCLCMSCLNEIQQQVESGLPGINLNVQSK
jgi:hypothetical protein